MFQVIDINDEARKIVGTCDDTRFFRWLSDAVTLIANKADFEGWRGFLDICTSGSDGRYLSLPREVQTVLAVNIGGRPTLGQDQLFNFHLNGLGDCRQGCTWTWQDMGANHPVYRDLDTPAKLVAYVSTPEDSGKMLVVHGFDSFGAPLRHTAGTEARPGLLIPTVHGYALPDPSAPAVGRITAVTKVDTVGSIRLSTIDDSGLTGTTLGVYEPDERVPRYRRVKLGRPCSWVRIAYWQTNPIFKSLYDRIPLESRLGFLMAVRACKFYHETDLPQAHACEADAARMELEAQSKLESPVAFPIQVDDRNQIQDKRDYDIS